MTGPDDVTAGLADAVPVDAVRADAARVDAAAPIEPWLRELLRCPACRGTLVDGVGPDGQAELVCTDSGCHRAYPVRDGIPVLLVDDARLVGS